ncbi:MAG TPA: VWA domain-containing protein [Terriglobales bacterium]|nr:VWA domain-containing protein [Terriglobales bacterium]
MAALCLMLACGLVAGARGQNCIACGTPETLLVTAADSWTLHKQVNEVQVLFTASRHGRFITGLTEDDVQVQDNSKPATIVDFRDQDNLPLRIALLVDTSDSIRERFRFEQEAAAIFLRKTLRNDSDQAMIAGFDTRLHVTQDFTHDSRLLSTGIARLSPGGETAVFDSVTEACHMLARAEQGVVARVLIVVSDGDDNASKNTLLAAVAHAQQDEVTVYTLSTNFHSSDFPPDQNLKHLAEPTGGQALFPGTARHLERSFARISEELRHRYEVAYRPPEFATNGRFHRIRIWARKSGKNLKVKARQGYYAR